MTYDSNIFEDIDSVYGRRRKIDSNKEKSIEKKDKKKFKFTSKYKLKKPIMGTIGFNRFIPRGRLESYRNPYVSTIKNPYKK